MGIFFSPAKGFWNEALHEKSTSTFCSPPSIYLPSTPPHLHPRESSSSSFPPI
jgi:hypothetical protein